MMQDTEHTGSQKHVWVNMFVTHGENLQQTLAAGLRASISPGMYLVRHVSMTDKWCRL